MGDLRSLIRSVEIRDRSTNQYSKAIEFLIDVCDRMSGSDSRRVIKKMDVDLRPDGQPRFHTSWAMWNKFCHYVRMLQRSNSRWNGYFRKCHPIPEAMLDQFYEDVEWADHEWETDSEGDSSKEDSPEGSEAGEQADVS